MAYFASIEEAWGVKSLEKQDKPERKQEPEKKTFTMADKIFGQDVVTSDDVDTEPPVVLIPENRKLSNYEVKKYLMDVYKNKGIAAVWKLLDVRIQRQLLATCKNTVNDAKKWFEDLFKSPEKMLIILAALFILIVVLDTSGKKAESAPMNGYYYQPYYQTNPINLAQQGM